MVSFMVLDGSGTAQPAADARAVRPYNLGKNSLLARPLSYFDALKLKIGRIIALIVTAGPMLAMISEAGL